MSGRESADLSNQLTAIINTVVDGIITIDSSGTIRSFNPAAERIFGYTTQEAIGKNVHLLMPEPDRSHHDEYLSHYVTTGERRIIGIGREVEGLRKDGTRVPIDLAVSEMHIDGERWFTGIARDISDRKRAEAERERFFALGLDLFCVADFTGHFRRVNPAFSQVLGWTADELLGRPFLDFVHADDRAATVAEMGTLAEGAVTVRFRNRYRCKDGSWRWLSWNAQPQPAEGQIYATARDITDLRDAEDARRRSEENLAVTLYSIGDGVLATDAEGYVTRLNPVAQYLTGWTEAEATGRHVDDVFRSINAETRQPARVPSRDGLQLGTSHAPVNDTVLIARDGTERPIADSCAPIRGGDGDVVGSVFVFRDVTQEYVARIELRARATELQAFRHTLDQTLDCVFIFRADDLRNLYVNEGGKRQVGYTEAELWQMTPVDINPQFTLETFHQLVQPLRDGTQAVITFQTLHRHKDGHDVPVEVNLQLVTLAGQEPRFVAIVRDITERKRIEADLRALHEHLDEMVAARTAQLQASEQRFQNLFEFAPDALVTTNAQGVMTLVNRQAERIFGWSRAELVGQPVEMLMPQREGKSHLAPQEPYLQTAVPRAMGRGASNLRAVRKDGSQFPVEISLSPIEKEEGHAVVTAFRDVTEHRRLEADLRTSEARYRQLVEGASEVFYKVSTPDDPLRGRLEFVSQRALHITGRHPEDFIRDPELWVKSVHPDDLPALMESTLAAMSGPKSVTRIYRIQHADGKYRSIEDEITPVVDAQGHAIGYTGVARDITERRQLEAQLQQSQRMESVGRLAGGVAHDFNNLLTVVVGTVELILANRTEEAPLFADLQEVRRAGERAAGLTQQLLAFSRRQILQPKVLSLTTLLTDMLSMLQRLIGEDVTMTYAPRNDLGLVKADPGQIEQIIVNIVVNARDAMPNGGTLTFETQDVLLDEAHAAEHAPVPTGPYVMLAVRDTGTGMDEATRRQIFEPFFTTKAPGKGTGLGLSTVYGIVRQSGGSILVDSDIGRGSTFKIYLPRVEGIIDTDRHVQTVAAPRGSETILLVEDEEAVRRLATRFLESAGYVVLAAANGEEALRLLERCAVPVRLLLTDVIMPGLSGRALANQVSARYPEVRVIFTSGYTDDAIMHHGVLDEGRHFLSKPYTAVDVTRKVREVLDS